MVRSDFSIVNMQFCVVEILNLRKLQMQYEIKSRIRKADIKATRIGIHWLSSRTIEIVLEVELKPK